MSCGLFETKLGENDEPYFLVWLHIGERQYHKPTLKELKEIVEMREARER